MTDGWLTLNGKIVAEYPADEYWGTTMTEGGHVVPDQHAGRLSYWTGGVDTEVKPIRNAQKKVTGYKVTRLARPTATCTGPSARPSTAPTSTCRGSGT